MAGNTEVTLKSSDGRIYKVDEAVASLSKVLKMVMNNEVRQNKKKRKRETERSITLQNVSGKILGLVIDYCTYHVQVAPGASAETARIWDVEFMKPLVNRELVQLAEAARYLDIYSLLDLTCESIAHIIKGQTPEKIREILNIKNDQPPE